MSFGKQPLASNFVHGVQLRALLRELETRRRKALLLLPHATRPPSQGWMNSSGSTVNIQKYPKLSKSRNRQRNSSTWPVQPSLINTTINHHYLNHICMAKECKRELVQSNTPRFERTANTMEKQSQGTGPVSRYLWEPSLQIARTVLHDWLAVDWEVFHDIQSCWQTYYISLYLLVSHCHVTSCPTSLIRIPYIGSPQPLHFLHISTGDAQGPQCCSHPTVAMASALRPCPLAFHIMGFVSSREILVEPCCYLCLQF